MLCVCSLQELELKFSETSQYMNMRKILETKNATIKELRTNLKRYVCSRSKLLQNLRLYVILRYESDGKLKQL